MSARARCFALLLAPALLTAALPVAGPAFAQGAASPHAGHGNAGTPGDPATEQSVRTELQRQGFTDIRDIRREGDKFTAMATKNGKTTKVELLASALGSNSTR